MRSLSFVRLCMGATVVLTPCSYRMLDDLEGGVDRTDSKLSDAMRRMRKFIRQTEGLSFHIPTLL